MDYCPICGRSNVATIKHHVATRRHSKGLVMRVCETCHEPITTRQRYVWESSWKPQDDTPTHIRCIIQGVADVLWVAWESGLGRQISELFHVIVAAIREILGLLGLQGWEGAYL